MNKLGSGYNDDERGHYNFSFSDSDGKHISVSFRAEPDYDLDIVFNEFKNFLIASGHDVEGDIGELLPCLSLQDLSEYIYFCIYFLKSFRTFVKKNFKIHLFRAPQAL